MSEITARLISIWHDKVIEPEKRMFEGSYGWATHRFPIKGGISRRDAIIRDMMQPSPLWKLLTEPKIS